MAANTIIVEKYRYNVINKEGQQEEWTGAFDTIEEAQRWHELHGEFHESRGHKLVFVKYLSTQTVKEPVNQMI